MIRLHQHTYKNEEKITFVPVSHICRIIHEEGKSYTSVLVSLKGQDGSMEIDVDETPEEIIAMIDNRENRYKMTENTSDILASNEIITLLKEINDKLEKIVKM